MVSFALLFPSGFVRFATGVRASVLVGVLIYSNQDTAVFKDAFYFVLVPPSPGGPGLSCSFRSRGFGPDPEGVCILSLILTLRTAGLGQLETIVYALGGESDYVPPPIPPLPHPPREVRHVRLR